MSLAKPFSARRDTIESVLLNQQHDIELMHDVLLLLENLFKREDETVKLILGRLYDIGSRTLIDQKVHYRPVNKLMGWVAKHTKPIAVFVGLRWFKKKAPKLVSDWLYSQVALNELPWVEPTTIPSDTLGLSAQSQPQLVGNSMVSDSIFSEIQRLRTQVRWLSGLSIGVLTVLLGVLLR